MENKVIDVSGHRKKRGAIIRAVESLNSTEDYFDVPVGDDMNKTCTQISEAGWFVGTPVQTKQLFDQKTGQKVGLIRVWLRENKTTINESL